jgi:hypothetical protein
MQKGGTPLQGQGPDFGGPFMQVPCAIRPAPSGEASKRVHEDFLSPYRLEEVERTFISMHGYLHFYERDFFFSYGY